MHPCTIPSREGTHYTGLTPVSSTQARGLLLCEAVPLLAMLCFSAATGHLTAQAGDIIDSRVVRAIRDVVDAPCQIIKTAQHGQHHGGCINTASKVLVVHSHQD